MKGKRFTEEQIISILKEHEAGTKVQDLVRKHNVSEQSIYRWKSKYGGMERKAFRPRHHWLCDKGHR
jgi:putative transposase